VNISVKVTGRSDRTVQKLQADGRIQDLLTHLGLSRQEYLVSVNDEMASVETPLRDGDDVLLVRAVSGG
jgi:sulfur carrier protein ThiS